jgi:hypothetical protein
MFIVATPDGDRDALIRALERESINTLAQAMAQA